MRRLVLLAPPAASDLAQVAPPAEAARALPLGTGATTGWWAQALFRWPDRNRFMGVAS